MTRDGTVGRPDATERSLPLHWDIDPARVMRPSVRGLHQGQQSIRTASTGRTHDCKRLLCGTRSYLLPGGGHPHMKRRDFIGLTASVVISPVRAWASPSPPRVGYLSAGTADS